MSVLEDIRLLSKEDKIHKLILANALVDGTVSLSKSPSPYTPGVMGGTRQSVRSAWDDEQQLTEDEIYEVFSKIADRIYYITKIANFQIVTNNTIGNTERVDTIRCGTTPDEVESIIERCYKNKYLIFYRIFKVSDVYHLRVLGKDDIIQIRDNKINDILGE